MEDFREIVNVLIADIWNRKKSMKQVLRSMEGPTQLRLEIINL